MYKLWPSCQILHKSTRPLVTGIALGTLVLASGVVGCDSLFRAAILPATETPSAAPASKTSKSDSFTALEKSIYEQINQYRQSRHLPPLTLDSRISEQARLHSQAMASGRVPFSHQGFKQRVKVVSRMIPYHSAAENVAYNQGYGDPDREAVQGWLKSTEHRINIEGQYDLTGIGIAKNTVGEYYFTQIFIRRR